MNVILRCDAGRVPEIGTGHARRCMRIAARLSASGHTVRFFSRERPGARDIFADAPFPVTWCATEEEPASALRRAVEAHAPDLVVFDLLDTRAEDLAACRAHGAKTITLDDRGAGLAAADTTINAIMEHPDATYNGPRFIILANDLASRPGRSPPRTPMHVLVSVGGYDHRDLTPEIVSAIGHRDDVASIHIIGGKATAAALRERAAHPVTRHESVADFAGHLSRADVAVVGGGLTLFDAMAAGTPSIVVPQYPHQVETARRYAARGATQLACDDVTANVAETIVASMDRISDIHVRRKMSDAGQALVDGGGLDRVVAIIERVGETNQPNATEPTPQAVPR